MPGARRLILFKVLEWIALGSIGVITAIKAVGAPASPADTLEMLQRDIVRRYVLWVAILNGVAIVGRLGQALLASESKARVKAVLTVLDEACFGNQPPAERHYNRVTLFKAGWRQKKLKPYARARRAICAQHSLVPNRQWRRGEKRRCHRPGLVQEYDCYYDSSRCSGNMDAGTSGLQGVRAASIATSSEGRQAEGEV